jgi:hypothetical protein
VAGEEAKFLALLNLLDPLTLIPAAALSLNRLPRRIIAPHHKQRLVAGLLHDRPLNGAPPGRQPWRSPPADYGRHTWPDPDPPAALAADIGVAYAGGMSANGKGEPFPVVLGPKQLAWLRRAVPAFSESETVWKRAREVDSPERVADALSESGRPVTTPFHVGPGSRDRGGPARR